MKKACRSRKIGEVIALLLLVGPSKKSFVYLLQLEPFEMMKNVFYLSQKLFPFLGYLNFCSDFFDQ